MVAWKVWRSLSLLMLPISSSTVWLQARLIPASGASTRFPLLLDPFEFLRWEPEWWKRDWLAQWQLPTLQRSLLCNAKKGAEGKNCLEMCSVFMWCQRILHDKLENGLLQRGQHRSTVCLGSSSVPANVFEDVVTTECAAVTLDGVTTGLADRVTVDGGQNFLLECQ